jgi:hypothetical protein
VRDHDISLTIAAASLAMSAARGRGLPASAPWQRIRSENQYRPIRSTYEFSYRAPNLAESFESRGLRDSRASKLHQHGAKISSFDGVLQRLWGVLDSFDDRVWEANFSRAQPLGELASPFRAQLGIAIGTIAAQRDFLQQ